MMYGSMHAEKPRVSVVIPSHNRPDLLRACLQSVLKYAPPGIEVIVVDDDSPAGCVRRVAASFGGVRVIPLSHHQGFCAAANVGIEAARSPIVELLNDDTEVRSDWVTPALECFQNPTVVAVAPLVLQFGSTEPRIDSAGDSYHWGGFATKIGHGQRLDDFPLVLCDVFGASGSCAFYRKDAVLRVGAFPETFVSYFEDVDLSFRLRGAGGRIVFCPRSQVWHHIGASHGPPADRLLEQQSRNEELVFWRNIPSHAMPLAVPVHLVVLAAKALKRWREGRLSPFLKGRWQALKSAGQVLKHRSIWSRAAPGDSRVHMLTWSIGAGVRRPARIQMPKSR